MRHSRSLPSDPRAAAIVLACESLLPIVRSSKQLLRRRRLAADELAHAVPGLDLWARPYDRSYRGIDIATFIATGFSAYEIVARVTGTRRKPDQVKKLYEKWRASRPRAR
jgi:hypothetical protein